MVFSSLLFLFFFFAAFFFFYFVLPKQCRNGVLLLFSLLFYAWGEPVYVLLMIGMSFSDYCLGRRMQRFWGQEGKRRACLIASLVIDLGALAFFKYADFLLSTVGALLRVKLPLVGLALPIGISFFTFQTLSYTIDLYRGEVTAERNYLDYLTYVSMFPQLIAGPIVRYATVREELHARTVTADGFYDGGRRFLYGLLKKVLLANQLGQLWEAAAATPSGELTAAFAWLGAVAFTLQLYLDFSAYSDMAIGLGQMLGFHFPENFRYPLAADSVTDFWRRWHISLSTWFRDYVYIPLGGNRCTVGRHLRNLGVVWFLTGLWHGASWNFILWGVYYGILLGLEKYVWGKALKRLPAVLRHAYLLLIVVFGFTLFAIEDFSALGGYLGAMFLGTGGLASRELWFYLQNYGVVLLAAVLVSMPLYPRLSAWVSKRKPTGRRVIFAAGTGALLLLFLVSVSYLVADTYNPFLYFRF